jgi:hypothetical protein
MKTNKTLSTSGNEHRLCEIDSADLAGVQGGFVVGPSVGGVLKLAQLLTKLVMAPDHDDHPTEPLT